MLTSTTFNNAFTNGPLTTNRTFILKHYPFLYTNFSVLCLHYSFFKGMHEQMLSLKSLTRGQTNLKEISY